MKPEAGSRKPEEPNALPADGPLAGETCDYCGAEALVWRKCKLICGQCHHIIKSCADL